MSTLAGTGRLLKSLVPRAVKHALVEARTGYRFRQALKKILDLPAEQVADPALLTELRRAWANDGYVGRVEYLLEIAERALSTPGPILECGSGLSTILLGLLSRQRRISVWSLEHMAAWHTRVRLILEPFRVPSVHLHVSALRGYGDFDWYDPPLAEMPREFRFVICDGPPWTTRGGRYGLFPVMRDRLPKGSIVLLDDVRRPEEQNTVHRWAAEAGWVASMKGGPSSTFAVITV